ncbi:MAG: hypothetical protein KME28_26815 [Pelatocladus maniniholoensis HA4357-MV3]|jgi:hypothetical protein|uniref:Uncharacterized protein n=2 Tax=Nostocales TaxID=1161 RepID=A0A9E3LX47_9NOST|nr:hypothetical protein [Pelatocladus maniniholoensis HA4357-MV3]
MSIHIIAPFTSTASPKRYVTIQGKFDLLQLTHIDEVEVMRQEVQP